MTANNIIPTIRIHPILTVFLLIGFLTGTFYQLVIILSIVLLHELGHYAAAAFFKWRINYIMLWIFGGVMVTEEDGNRPLHQEIIVTLAGPFLHIVIFILLYFYSSSSFNFIQPSILEMVYLYNTLILLFNLLPIWPLDGGKIIFYLSSHVMPFRRAHNFILIFSMAVCIIVLILQLSYFPFNLSAFLLMIFLLIENKQEWKKRYYVFVRFLLNRYHGRSNVNNVSYISAEHTMSLHQVFQLFQKGKKHIINVSFPNQHSVLLDENDCLRLYFHERKINVPIGELQKIIL